MPVTVDHQPLAAETLGLRTVGQLLSHLRRDDRLVVHVVLDGREPDPGELGPLKTTPLQGHTLSVETADPRKVAAEALDGVAGQMDEAERLREQAVHLLEEDRCAAAMEKLSRCFSAWQTAHESTFKTARLMRLDPATVRVDGRPLDDLAGDFAAALGRLKSALEHRDFHRVAELLNRDMADAQRTWTLALEQMRRRIEPA